MYGKALYKVLIAVCLSQAGTLHAQDIENLGKNKPVVLRGSISAGLNYFTNFSGNSQSTASFGQQTSYFLQGNPVLSLYGFDIPVNITIASQNKSFHHPFNRYGLSPSYRWAKLHLGWRSLNFSQFTLGGQQILGAGVELNPGKLRVGFIYGTFNNAVTDISLYNNLNNNVPLFKRKGFAAKLGYGSSSNFLEFSYLQAKDIENSVSKLVIDSILKPAANQVAGIKGQLTLFKKLSFSVDAAASYYTRNIKDSLLDTGDKFPGVTPSTSSTLSFAGEAGIQYNYKGGNINLKYRRIEPGYRSMGAFYMQTDIEHYTAGINQRFLRNKVRLRANFGWQQNNLASIAAHNSKRTIGNVGINISPNNTFGIDINYSNYGISQQIIPQLDNPQNLARYDSVRISQVNQSFSVSPRVFIQRKNTQHNISAQANFQKLHNANAAQRDADFNSFMGSLNYGLAFPERKISINNTFNYFNSVFTDNKSATMGYNFGISKYIAGKAGEEKAFIESAAFTLSGGYFANSTNGQSTGNTFSLNPSIQLGVTGKQSLQLMGNYTNTSGRGMVRDLSRQQMMISARYNVSF